MKNENLIGYKKNVHEFLRSNNISTWNEIEIMKGSLKCRGILLPRNKFAKDGFIEIKLKNGYNIGIEVTEDTSIKIIKEKPPMSVSFEGISVKPSEDKKNVTLLGTGGTIASRLDYVTGAVLPAFEPHELFAAVPELSEICNLKTEMVFKILSENMTPKYWLKLAKKVAELSNSGVDGVVIGHGTDTMGYSTAALSFLLQNLKIPVVFVGSQRSSDRPSSDAALNLINAVTLASEGDFAEVVLCMLGSSSHTYGFIHKGTLVRKMHSSARNTFRTIGDVPLGKIENGKITYYKNNYKKRSAVDRGTETIVAKNIEDRIGIIYFHPGMDSGVVDFYIDKGYKGLVIAGTGLGHVSQSFYKSLQRAKEEEILVIMTVQTLWGFTGMDVYETGRELQEYGVLPGLNMLPETAFAKMCWVLGNFQSLQEAKNLMITNVSGEILEREEFRGFKILQGVE
jgi:glutamyl-tRNA(Gln) amidotransferase subunit D